MVDDTEKGDLHNDQAEGNISSCGSGSGTAGSPDEAGHGRTHALNYGPNEKAMHAPESTKYAVGFSVLAPSTAAYPLAHGTHPAAEVEESGANDADHLSQLQETFPEGGLEAWLVVLGAWLALFSSLGILNSLATFQSYVTTHQLVGESQGTIGWIFSLNAFVCFFTGVYVGPIFDKHGPRWLVLAGTLCLVVSLVLLSFCAKFWHFILVFGLMDGLASALLFTPSIAAVGHFFRERRGFATGIASTGGGIGGVCIPLMLQSLFDRVGWGWAIRVLALVSLVLAGLSNLLLRSRLPPALDASTHPDIRIFRNMPFLLTTLGVFLLEFALFVPLTYISTYALSRGFSPSFASQLVTIVNAGSVAGRVLPGWYADKIGPFNANMIAAFLAAVSCLAVWLPASLLGSTRTNPGVGGDGNSVAAAPVVIFALLFGFTSGSNISLVPVSIGRLCATTNYGRYYATCYTIVSVATLVGIPIAGNILMGNGGEYWGLIVFTAALYLGSLVALYAAKASVVGWSVWTNF
ncbi:hypothetical protein SCUCBS95973_009161 [Sporothrix curviconia]|uniref:Major facilitator superfamily (MFS) profile domain-containing protein n=1 Tax=Sporothrix curviconia TaxID=1260050 RepID=A0ABP0CSW6_9PEZI